MHHGIRVHYVYFHFQRAIDCQHHLPPSSLAQRKYGCNLEGVAHAGARSDPHIETLLSSIAVFNWIIKEKKILSGERDTHRQYHDIKSQIKESVLEWWIVHTETSRTCRALTRITLSVFLTKNVCWSKLSFRYISAVSWCHLLDRQLLILIIDLLMTSYYLPLCPHV